MKQLLRHNISLRRALLAWASYTFATQHTDLAWTRIRRKKHQTTSWPRLGEPPSTSLTRLGEWTCCSNPNFVA